jgi:signal transduction histidine kinase
MGIRERFSSFGGDVKIKGVNGKGTTITVSVPLKEIVAYDKGANCR